MFSLVGGLRWSRSSGNSDAVRRDAFSQIVSLRMSFEVVRFGRLRTVLLDQIGKGFGIFEQVLTFKRLRHLVEDCGLCRIFWTDDGQRRDERFAQLPSFGIADSYCKANDIDLSPEVNAGRGPVDFKLQENKQENKGVRNQIADSVPDTFSDL